MGANRQRDILNTLRKFSRYGFVDPSLIADIPIPAKQQRQLTREDLITKAKLKILVQHARDARDKALISSLYESQARIGEFISLERRHFQFDKKGVRITIPESKSQIRTVRVVESVGHLINWRNTRGDHLGMFWFYNDRRTQADLTDKDVVQMAKNFRNRLKTAKRRAGITKAVFPHLFRHSSTTEYLKVMKPSSVRQRGGWKKGSKTMSRYYD